MTQLEAKKLSLSLYVLYWKSGGSSIASVGQLYDGTRWFAPCNWTNEKAEGICSTKWHYVDKVAEVKVPKRLHPED